MDSRLTNQISKFQAINKNNLLRTDLPEKSNFADLENDFSNLFNYYKILIDSIENQPKVFQNTLLNFLTSFNSIATSILNLQDLSKIPQIKNNVGEHKFSLLRDLGSHMFSEVSGLNEKISLSEELSATKNELIEAKELLKESKDAIKGSEADKYGNYFSKEAEENNKRATFSFLGMILCLFLLIVFSYIWKVPQNSDTFST